MKLNYNLIAQHISVDQNTNNISAFNILDEIVVSSIDEELVDFCIVNAFEVSKRDKDREFILKTQIDIPQEGSKTFSMSLTPSTSKNSHRVFQTVARIPIISTGVVKIRCFLDGKLIASRNIPITLDEREWSSADEEQEPILIEENPKKPRSKSK